MNSCAGTGVSLAIHIRTYGCQMNERDSESIGALLVRAGHRLVAEEEAADVVIVNTCSVRGKAEDKALGKLGLLVAERKPGRIVGAVGCMVQRLCAADAASELKKLDFAIGTRRLSTLPAVVEAVRAGRGPVFDAGDGGDESEALAGHLGGRVSAFVNVLLGCDRHCSYCIVPAVRGREWSRPGANIVREVEGLAGSGVVEVTLLGQSVMSYGRANPVWPEGYSSRLGFVEALPRLLEAVSGVPGIRRVRFTSGHPCGCSDELVRAMAALPPVCDHLHLPVQSGSDRILKTMRRGYTAREYLDAVARLRGAIPTLALTTDVIVGFPGETLDDFERTRDLMEAAGFDNAFIFKYSPREGTPAAALPDDVPPDEKLRRNHVLLADQDRRGQEINRRLVGHSVEVLAEGPSLRNKARWAGRTRTNKIVVFDASPRTVAGAIVRALIERAGPQTLYGRIESETPTP